MNLPALICVLFLLAGPFAASDSDLPDILREGFCSTIKRDCCGENWRYYTYPEDLPEGAPPPNCFKSFYELKQCNATHCYCGTLASSDPRDDKAVKIGEDFECEEYYDANPKPKLLDIMINGVCTDRTLPCCKELWKAVLDGRFGAHGSQNQYRCDQKGFFKPRQCLINAVDNGGCWCVRHNETDPIPNTFAAYPKRTKCEDAR